MNWLNEVMARACVHGWSTLIPELTYWLLGLGGSVAAALWVTAPMGWAIGLTGAMATVGFHLLQAHIETSEGPFQKRM